MDFFVMLTDLSQWPRCRFCGILDQERDAIRQDTDHQYLRIWLHCHSSQLEEVCHSFSPCFASDALFICRNHWILAIIINPVNALVPSGDPTCVPSCFILVLHSQLVLSHQHHCCVRFHCWPPTSWPHQPTLTYMVAPPGQHPFWGITKSDHDSSRCELPTMVTFPFDYPSL
jgi:hypothetical protein